jgi:hypothetical protein
VSSKDILTYIDKFGLVCKKQPPGSVPLLEGGDTCANEFTLLYCGLYSPSTRARLITEIGVPIRHPLLMLFGEVSRSV